MKKKTVYAVHSHFLLKIIMALLAALFLSAAVSVIAFAEDKNTKELAEILSVRYAEPLTQGKDSYEDSYVGADSIPYELQPIPCEKYNLNHSKIALELRFSDETVLNCTLSDLYNEYRSFFGDAGPFYFIETGQEDKPWRPGVHTCTITISGISKQFEVEVLPNPVETITATQIATLIEGVSNNLYDAISVTVCKTDGSTEKIRSGFSVTPSGDIEKWEAGSHDVAVSYMQHTTQLSVEIVPNPYTEVNFNKERPFEVELTKTDLSKETLPLNIARYSDINGITSVSIPTDNDMIVLRYDSENDTVRLGETESVQTVSEIEWLKVLIEGSHRLGYAGLFSWKPDFTQRNKFTYDYTLFYAGMVTPENLDRLVLIAFLSSADLNDYQNRVPSEPEFISDWEYSVPLERMQQMMFETFGLKDVDLSSSKRYDADREIMFGIEGFGDGGEGKTTVAFEKGMYVFRAYAMADREKQILEEYPHLTVTFNGEAQITGIYFSELPGKKVGDVDGNGKVEASDARLALRASVGLERYAPFSAAFIAADAIRNGKLEPDDARVILRTSVGLEEERTNDDTVLKAPTCTDEGTVSCFNPDDPGNPRIEAVAPLGHDFSLLVSVMRPGTCASPGYGTFQCFRCSETIEREIIVEHEWQEATCTAPKTCINCGATSGSALGHTTFLGECKRCRRYQNRQQDHLNANIIKPLNDGVNALQNAYNVMYQKYAEDYSNRTITLKEAIPYYIVAYNYYYTAYEACGDYGEFAEAKELICTICYKLLEIICTGDVTAENYNKTMTDWTLNSYAILDPERGYNAALKPVIDSMKDPNETVATQTDAESAAAYF